MTIKMENSQVAPSAVPRDPWRAMARGMACKCPACGAGSIYGAYLKVEPVCAVCGTELHHHRADDAPPYFTMFIVGHLIVGGVLSVEKAFHPSTWVHMALWLPLTVLLSLLLLPVVKGSLIGLQWALRMHGFGSGRDPAGPDPIPVVNNGEKGR
jgi:uncharacterized protein (DUF983 family)